MIRFVTTWIALCIWCLGRQAIAQPMLNDIPVSPSCLGLSQQATSQIRGGSPGEWEAALIKALSAAENRDYSCMGALLYNIAVVTAASGRLAEAADLVERSIQAFAKSSAPDDPILLRPLQLLAAARLEAGQMAMAREVFQRMRLIRAERPSDRALFHGIAGWLLDADGKRAEAEAEYAAAIVAWQEAGRGENADAGNIVNGLGVLYIKEGRLDDAERILERASAILSNAPDAFPIDRLYFLDTRGILRALQGKWQEAEQDLREAVSIADQQAKLGPQAMYSLLTHYVDTLRKNHQRRDARVIGARIAAIRREIPPPRVVDVTDLLANANRGRK